MILANYNFASFLWDVLVIFAFVIWFWLLVVVFGDVFRRRDISGWGKAGWIIFTVFLPFLGIFVYLIANSKGMAERNMKQVQTAQADTDAYIKSVAGSDPAATIEKGHELLEKGALTQAEFEQLKASALAQG